MMKVCVDFYICLHQQFQRKVRKYIDREKYTFRVSVRFIVEWKLFAPFRKWMNINFALRDFLSTLNNKANRNAGRFHV